MVWLLPVIVIGGLFNAYLGYLMVAMMAVLLGLAVFRGRYWCWYLCPRGAFLDLVMQKVSAKKPAPRFFTRQWFRWTVFVLFMIVLVLRIVAAGGNRMAIGAIFVSVCIVATVIAVVLIFISTHRGWCMVCPMGFLQEKLGKLKNKKNA